MYCNNNKYSSVKLWKLTLCFCVVWAQNLSAQCDFMMQGWYWDYPVGWSSTLQTKVAGLGSAGFTYVWLPPLSRGSSGISSSGYDPKDLYDLGEYGQGPTRFGTRTNVNSIILALNSAGIKPVADLVYNHRDGGKPEVNAPVKNYITTYYNAAKEPFPSDRFRCILPIGAATNNGAGDYYIKISSKTNDARFNAKNYTFYAQTNRVGWQNLPNGSEAEPNGGGDCGQSSCTASLGRNFTAQVETGTACGTDEYKITLGVNDFFAAGDTLFIFMANGASGLSDYSDHRIYGLYSTARNADIVGEVKYQTYTDFTAMPSGQGAMNFENFKPNTSNATTQYLAGDWDGMYFFYDYDQFNADTETKLTDWTKWMWSNVGVRGLRMDAIKHFTPAYVRNMLQSMNAAGYNPGMVVGEWFDSNANILKSWVDNVYLGMNAATSSAIKVRIFDFALREALKNTCDNGSDARNIFTSGIVDGAGASGFNSVTFVQNHDFRDAFQPVFNDVQQAYAYILTNNKVGTPTVFYPDYFGIQPNANYPPGVNLEAQIKQLMQAHNLYICNSTGVDYLNKNGTGYSSNFISGSSDRSLIYQLTGNMGGRSVVVAINFSGNVLKVDHQINTSGAYGGATVGTRFTDILARSNYPFALVDGSNRIYMEVPPHSYSVWVQGTQAPLAAEIVKFEVKAVKDFVRINWVTSNERDMEKFEIERSSDGKTFEFLTAQKANASQGGNAAYQFDDKTAWVGSEIYYRLKSVGKDGAFEYAPIQTARIDKISATFTVSPNPTTDLVGVKFSSDEADEETNLAVSNELGEIVFSQKVSCKKGENSVSIDLQRYPAGVYLVRLDRSTFQVAEKIIKQ